MSKDIIILLCDQVCRRKMIQAGAIINEKNLIFKMFFLFGRIDLQNNFETGGRP